MPCEVRAYLRFSIFRLQFLHRKHVAQNAWSPVRMAKSSILLPQALQLYVQLLQIREPSPSSSRFASESRRVPHVLHRKQLRCHLLPAVSILETLLPLGSSIEESIAVHEIIHCGLVMFKCEIRGHWDGKGEFTYQVRMLCLPPGSR